MRNNLLLALSALCVLLCCTAPASAFSDLRKRESKKERAAEAKKPGKYEKLFEKGVEKRASGAFATLHKVNGKLYLEFPLELLGREMLLSSATVQTSDSRFCIVGYRTRTPMHLRFTVRDTLLTILRSTPVRTVRTTEICRRGPRGAELRGPRMGGVPDSGLQSRQYGARFRCYQTAFGLQRPCDGARIAPYRDV